MTEAPLVTMHTLILAGTSTEEIEVKMKEQHPDFPCNARSISYNRTQLRHMGQDIPRAGRSDKGKPRGANKAGQKKAAAIARAKMEPAPKKPVTTAAKPEATTSTAPSAKKPANKTPELKYGVSDLAVTLKLSDRAVRDRLRKAGVEKVGQTYGWTSKAAMSAIVKQLREATAPAPAKKAAAPEKSSMKNSSKTTKPAAKKPTSKQGSQKK